MHPTLSSDEDLEAKFSCAGASARWMFGTWLDLRRHMDYYISRVSNTEAVVKGFVGTWSDTAINHLFTTFGRVAEIVSREITIELVSIHSIVFIKAAREQPFSNNPTFNWWIFEAEVLLQVLKKIYL